MHLACSRRDLNDAVQTVARAAALQTTLPILNHILLVANDDRLILTGSDPDLLTCRTSIAVEGCWPEGIAIPAKAFSELLNHLPDGPIELDLQPRQKLLIRQGEIRFELRGLAAEEFPRMPVVHVPGDSAPMVQVPQVTLRRMLRQTVFAVGLDQTRVQYTGILFERDEEMFRLVACDGVVRIAVSSVRIDVPGAPFSAIVPHRTLQELGRVLRPEGDPVTIYFRNDFLGPTLASFEVSGVMIVTRLIEGQFAPWRHTIPLERRYCVTVRSSDLLATLRRMEIVARDDHHRVQFNLAEQTLQLNSVSSTLGNAEERISALIEGGETLIALDGRYLSEGVAALDAEGCHIELTGALSPCVVRPLEGDDYLYIQSPMHPS